MTYRVYEFGKQDETAKLFNSSKSTYKYLVEKYDCKNSYNSFMRALSENFGSCALYQELRVVCIERVY